MTGWNIVITMSDGSEKVISAKNKIDASVKRSSYIHKPNVKYADVFEDDDYIDPTEL